MKCALPALPQGVLASLTAALLFGASTPLAKLLLEQAGPWLLAALLYLGSGLGLVLWRFAVKSTPVRLAKGEIKWLAGAVISGGLVGPVLLMVGLTGMTASAISLMLNAESVFTALLAWFVFKENIDRRVALGMAAIIAGGVVLAWPSSPSWPSVWPALCVALACLAWAIDNNLTRHISLADASWIAMVKGLAAGATNLVLAFAAGAVWPSMPVTLAAGLVGFVGYGASLVLFVVGLRELGAARTGAYFSVAPFFGAVLAFVLLGESVTVPLMIAALLMTMGVVLHLTERHDHLHTHEPMEHAHEHVHGAADLHHDHVHEPPVAPGTRHNHVHRHQAQVHSHPHFPDAHHRHRH